MMEANLLNKAFDAAIAAGKVVMDVYDNGNFEVEMKADHSPLTIADRAAHDVILKHLESTEIPVLSEEGSGIPFEKRRYWKDIWIVDPIDGTKEFIRRNGEFTINIALIRDHFPILGVVYAPAIQTIYVAAENIGSLKAEVGPHISRFDEFQKNALPLPQPVDSKTYRVVGSRSHMNEETLQFIHKKQQEHPEVEMVSKGSSLKMCLVAEGSAHCYPRFAPTMEWDTAAGQAICRYAGKIVLDMETGEEMTYNREKLLNNWFLVE